MLYSGNLACAATGSQDGHNMLQSQDERKTFIPWSGQNRSLYYFLI